MTDFGCEYCANEEYRAYGHVEQIATDDVEGLLLLACPRCGALYEVTCDLAATTRRLTREEALARFPGTVLPEWPPAPPFDRDRMSELWAAAWPGLRPIGHELRAGEERWVRFHALPGSKRYPETEQEYGEVLRRHNLLLDELVARTGTASLLVMTVSWSGGAQPVARDPELLLADPRAEYWTSVLRDADDTGEYWTHVFVSSHPWRRGVLDPLLRLVADDVTADVIVADDRLRWLVHPYDGGVDVLLDSRAERDRLRSEHEDWLSSHPGGL